MATRRASAGFTLLEAIVAMALFAMAGLALFSWLGTNLIALERVEARQQDLADTRNALALLESVNPLLEPEGSRELGPLTVRWTSEPVAERREGVGPSGGLTVFDLALYDMQVALWREGQQVHAFSVRRAGWETVRQAMPEDF